MLNISRLPTTLVLCDSAFGRGPGGINTISSLRNTYQSNKPLDQFMVLSGTLLHELLHLANPLSGTSLFDSISQLKVAVLVIIRISCLRKEDFHPLNVEADYFLGMQLWTFPWAAVE